MNSVQDSDCTVVNEMVVEGVITTAGSGNNTRYRLVLNATYNFCDGTLGFDLVSYEVDCY